MQILQKKCTLDKPYVCYKQEQKGVKEPSLRMIRTDLC